MSISNHQQSPPSLGSGNKNKVTDDVISSLTINSTFNDSYAYSKHLKSPITYSLTYIDTDSAFTSEFDYSIYSLSNQDTIVTLKEEKENVKEMMKYFEEEDTYVRIKENTLFINNGDNIVDTGKDEDTTKNKLFYDDSSYDIYSCDSDYQSQSLQAFYFY
uniref:ATS domain-containing protein n=1 Tax=Strongyloides papillosus TaxID=174720 RepID=A0A0N5BHX6_STREA